MTITTALQQQFLDKCSTLYKNLDFQQLDDNYCFSVVYENELTESQIDEIEEHLNNCGLYPEMDQCNIYGENVLLVNIEPYFEHLIN